MAVDFYLMLDGITGESEVAAFKGQIQVQSYSFGGTNVSSVGVNGGSGAGKVNLGPLTITKQADSASGPLFLDMCKGTHIPKGMLSLVKSGGGSTAYITLEMTEVFVAGFTSSATGEVPVETVSLTYKSIVYTYKAQAADGTLATKAPAGWNVVQNKAV